MDRVQWHSFSIKDTLEKLDTSPNGLSSREANLRLRKFGLNELKKEKRDSEFIRFLSQFRNPLVYLLIVAAVITHFLQHYIDTYIIVTIVLLNALVGYLQERKAEKALQAIKKLMSLKSRVVRNEQTLEISALELVPGDIIILEEGIKVPADIRLIEAETLKADESILNGESVPVLKKSCALNSNINIIDQTNMLFAGTIVATGHGLGIVVNTGKYTELAQIAKEVSEVKEEVPHLEKKILAFSKNILLITIVACTIIFIAGTLRGLDVVNLFLTAVATAIAIIPEGLPAVITITLAIGVHRMAKQNAIVRKLSAIETLGSVTLIASDKTGTLTYNQMTLEKIYLDGNFIEVGGDGYVPTGIFTKNSRRIDPKNNPSLKNNLLISALCNNAKLIEDEKANEWKIMGDPTEGALIVAAEKAGIHLDELNEKYPRKDEIPFQSKNLFMATLNHDKKNNRNIIAVKGTIEEILRRCKQIYQNGKIIELDEKEKETILEMATKEANEAHRILAFAYKYVPANREKIVNRDIEELIFNGFSTLEDPPREDAIESIKKCQKAGIKVVMITGDFPATAKAIAIKVGIANNNSGVLSGDELRNMNGKQLSKIVSDISVFARVTPEMKLRIVEAYKNKNEIIGVTGDGINDAPVLKLADVGIAMGRGGTDVAREASDIVLLDDNFTSITNAVEEGRTIFQNIRRVIFFLISTNAAEALLLLATLALGLPLPLTAVQILWINLITDGASSFALAVEPKHEEIMNFKPRPVNEGILNKMIVTRIATTATIMTLGTLLFYWMDIKNGASIEHARTVAFVTIAFFQILNLLNSRSFKSSIFSLEPFSNPYIIFFFLGMATLTILTAQSELFRNLFFTTSLSSGEWIRIIFVSTFILLAVEIEKLLMKWSNRRY